MRNIWVSTLFDPEATSGTTQNRTADVVSSSFSPNNHNYSSEPPFSYDRSAPPKQLAQAVTTIAERIQATKRSAEYS